MKPTISTPPFLLAALLSTTLLAASTTTYAEKILVPVGQQGQSTINLPNKGASKDAVRAQFGEPASSTGPVGNPPITTWNYADFSVYFEYNHVIHAVRKHTPRVEQPPLVEPATTETAEPEVVPDR